MSEDSPDTKRSFAGLAKNQRVRRWVIGSIAAYAVYAIALGLIAPWTAREPIENLVGELLGVDAAIEHISVNPFTLRFEFTGIEMRELDGGLLLAAKSLVANVELLKSVTGVLRVDSLVLDMPEVHASLSPDYELNLLALMPEESDEPEEEGPEDEDSGLFPVRIDAIELIDGSIRYVDRSRAHLFVTSVQPINLVVHSISTVPDEEGTVRLEATSSRGIKLDTEFSASLSPLKAVGDLSLVGVRHNTIGDYLGPEFPVRPKAGEIDIHTDFVLEMDEVSGLVVRIEKGGIEARGWEAESDLAEVHRASLDRFAIEGFRLGLAERQLGIDQIVLEGPRIAAVLPGPGSNDADDEDEDDSDDGASVPGAPAEQAAPSAEPGDDNEPDFVPTSDPTPDWTFAVDRFAVTSGEVSLASHAAREEPLVEIGPIDLEALGISSVLGEGIELSVAIALPDTDEDGTGRTSADGARFLIEGDIVPRPFLAELELKAIEVALAPWSPLVGFAPGTRISGGRLDVTSIVKAALPEGSETPEVSASAEMNLRGLVVQQKQGPQDRSKPVIKIGRVLVQRVGIDDGGRRVRASNIRVDSPSIYMRRDAQGGLNLARLMAPSRAPANDGESSPMSFDLRRLEIADGMLDYHDSSTDRPFKIEITDIDGAVEQQKPGADGEPGTVDISARAYESVPIKIKGEFPADDALDIAVSIDGLAVTALGPYFEQYVGSEVEQGKLHVDLDYALQGRTIAGTNKLRFDRLIFGGRTGSKDAIKLPIPLAFKLLTDTKGQTVLDLPPIKGNLDDPDFSLRSLIMSAFMKVIQQALSSPLAVLHTAMPDLSADHKIHIEFAAGSAALDAPQLEKLMNIATVVASKKDERIAIKSRVDKRRDGRALRKAGEDVDDERLLELGRDRARAVLGEFVDRLGLEPDRIFLRATDLEGEATDGRVAIDVVLTDD